MKRLKEDNCKGICPLCHSSNIDYEIIELVKDMAYFPYKCKNCGQEGEEWYDMKFNSHAIDDVVVEDINIDEYRKEKGIELSNTRKREEYER